jgi:hypothetical protein
MATATARESHGADLTGIRDDLAGLREIFVKVDQAQDALLVNGNSLQGQIETLSGLIAHMIEALTPERPEQEGPSLADLLTRLVSQQSAMTGLMRQMLEIVTRLDPAPSRIAGHSSTEGAGLTAGPAACFDPSPLS